MHRYERVAARRRARPSSSRPDGSFISGLVGDRADRLIVEALVGVARSLGRQTIAEYVSDAEVCAAVRACGVDLVQGRGGARLDS